MPGVKILDSLPMTNNVLQPYQVCDKCAWWVKGYLYAPINFTELTAIRTLY